MAAFVQGRDIAAVRSWVVPTWALALGLLALGPALGPGHTLTYDMVFVPNPSLSWDQLGLGARLPRAVPLDAVTTVLATFVSSSVLQKAALLGALVAAGTGAAALVPTLPVLARLVAATVAVWNPFVAERLVLGHWGLLLAYGALPWLVAAVRRRREGVSGPAAVVCLLAVCALTPTGGLLSLLVLLVAGFARDRRGLRRLLLSLSAWLLLDAPWWLSGLLHRSAATADAASIEAFAARGELPGGVLPTLLGLGGVWNVAVVPDSRGTPIAVVGLVVLAALVGAGIPVLVSTDRDLSMILGVLAVSGLALALLGAVPGVRDALGWVAGAVPGAGLLRDGQKFVGLMVPAVATSAACGAHRLALRAPDRVSGVSVLSGASLLLVAVLPDLAWGVAGRLEAVRYPAGWADVREEVAEEPKSGDLLLLPWGSFRAYDWNDRRTVLDPGRLYFPRDVVADDRLAVGGVVLPPEDPRAAAVGRAIAGPGLDAAFLRRHGVRLVLVQTDQPGAPTGGALVHGTVPVLNRPGLTLARVPGPIPPRGPGVAGGEAARWAVLLVDLAAAGLALSAGRRLLAGRLRRGPGGKGPGERRALL